MAHSEVNDLPLAYRLRGPPSVSSLRPLSSSHSMLITKIKQRSKKIFKLLDDIVPLDDLPSVLVQHNQKTAKRPPLLHYGFPATEAIMAAICAMNGYTEGVEHPRWGKFDPGLIFSLGALYISEELDMMYTTELVYGSPTNEIFTFGDSRSPLRGETSKERITKLQAYLTANSLPYDKPRWYLDRDHFYWTLY